jgi:arginyl-tRNA synthetase
VGADVTRFMMLTRKNDVALDFDFDKALEQSKDNPVFYVQYAHARIRSVLRRAGAGLAELTAANRGTITHPADLAVVRRLAEWPRAVELAARTNEPHRIVFYLGDLAAEFHALWNRGTEEPALRFVQDGPEGLARLSLAHATGVVISAGLGILGVTPVEEMR